MLLEGRSFDVIYRYGFNGKEHDTSIYGQGNAYDYGFRTYDPRIGKFLSLDPLFAKYPNVSPFSAFLNNPMVVIDKDGQDNVIYLVYLPGPENTITLAEAKEMINLANLNFESLGVKTRVVLATDTCGCTIDKFDPNNTGISKETDAIAIIGGGVDVINFVDKFNTKLSSQLKESNFGNGRFADVSYDPTDPIYGSPNTIKVIALDPIGIKYKANEIDAKKAKVTFIQYGALTINHGAGHSSGMNHFRVSDFPEHPYNKKFEMPGFTLSIIMSTASEEVPGSIFPRDPLKEAIEKYGYNAVVSDNPNLKFTYTFYKTDVITLSNGSKKTITRKYVITTTANPDFDTYMRSSYGNNDSTVNYAK